MEENLMRTIVLVAMFVAMLAAATATQPKDGDLIVSGRGFPSPAILSIDPPSGKGSTLASFPTGSWTAAVRMAEDNTDLVAGFNANRIIRINPVARSASTMMVLPGNLCADLRLDHDGAWIACGQDPASPGTTTLLHCVPPATVSTIAIAGCPANSGEYFDAVAIDRDPAALGEYVLVRYRYSAGNDRVSCATRNRGIVSTLISGQVLPLLQDVTVDPATGNYLLCVEQGGLVVVSKDGSSRTTITRGIYFLLAAKPSQDGTIWLAGQDSSSRGQVTQIARNGTKIRSIRVPTTNLMPFGLEIYGSRKLVCHQQGKSVNIRLKSHRQGDRGSRYLLACSFNRRPPAPLSCLPFPGGELLFLDYTDPLFLTSALGLAPHVFQNFLGITSASGFAAATVNIPASLPPLNMTVFVAGVISNPGGVTVTNTHWFVL